MAVFSLRDFGARGNQSDDDTVAVVTAFSYMASNNLGFGAALYVPTGGYIVSDGLAGTNNQLLVQITGSGSSYKLDVTLASVVSGTSFLQTAAAPIPYTAGNGTANASAMQTALAAIPGVGTGNVAVVYQPDSTWYAVTFSPVLGAPRLALTPGSSTLNVQSMSGNPNQQALQIAGTYGLTFILNVTLGSLTGVATAPTAPITYSSSTSATATDIQNKLSTLVGAGNVVVTYNATYGWFVVTFAPSQGAPVMSASSTSLSVTFTVLQSGAAIIIPNLYGFRIFGDAGALADYDQPNQGGGLYAPSSRSLFIWRGTANGVMAHFLGCNDVTIENIGFVGATASGVANPARTGLLFSSNPLNPVGKQGGSRLTCRSVVSTRFQSIPTPSVSGCVQLGMNEDDSGGGTTAHQACTYGNGTNGILAVSSAASSHHVVGLRLTGLAVGIWMQQGGNLNIDGLKAEAVGTILKIGPGTQNPAYYPYYGGGKNAGVYLLRNVRTDLLTGPNINLVDATYASSGTQITIDGWDDTDASTDATAALIMGSGASVNLRHSLAARLTLAQESTSNVPNAIIPAALRLENLVVPEYTLAAALCQSLTANTKVDLVAERTAIYNIVRPDRSTMAGRPGYSPVDFLIEQQKPKYFFPLGDMGLLAPNLGWNLYISPTVPRSDGRYAGTYAQNVQGIVLTDAIGGFNSQGNGYVTLPSGNLSLGQISGQNWTLFVVAVRNTATGAQTIISNLSASTGGGGFQLQFDASGHVVFTSDNGSMRFVVPGGTPNPLATPVYILVQVVPNSAIKIYLNGSSSADGTQTLTTGMTYSDNGVVPVIAATPGMTPTPSNVQVARLATFDLLVSLAAWANIFNYGNSFQGR